VSSPVAFVTGASRGVGAAVAQALAEDGHDVVVAYRRDHDGASQVSERVRSLGRRCLAVAGSLADPEDCARLARAALDEFGRVDVVVHAAGVACPAAEVAVTPVAEFERQLGVHLYGPLRLTQVLVPHLREQERSSIVFVSSAVTQHMRGLGSPYNVAKAAMEALARTLANEERQHGVRVNIVSPGLVDTDLGRRFVRAAHGRDIAELAPLLPFGRVCRPEDIADVVRWLASDRAAYLSGENIVVNGGDDHVSSQVEATRVALEGRLEAGTP
jgi:NAD(P)-dependent dehydrogenase (short-subunit alcohol dehydrogenase family)